MARDQLEMYPLPEYQRASGRRGERRVVLQEQVAKQLDSFRR